MTTEFLSRPQLPDFARLRPLLERWRDDPVAFVREALRASPELWQIEALQAIVEGDRLAIRSGHGVGKSAFLAWVIIWWLLTRSPAKVACTAPSAHQLNDVLWGEIAIWRRQLIQPLNKWLIVKEDRVELLGAGKTSFAAARTARKESPEAFQGFHSEHMLFIADEASGVDDIIFEVGEGAMSTHGAKTILTGNPTRLLGYFYNAFHEGAAFWRTMKVSSLDSTRVDPEFIERMKATWGENSDVYRYRVLGEFPQANSSAVIPLNLIEDAVDRDVEAKPTAPVIWGLDVARFGRARTALVKRKENVMLEPAKAWSGKDLMQTAGIVKIEYDTTPISERPVSICVDVIGLGAGVVDRLRELKLPVVGINVAESPSVQDQFLMLRDELWWRAREWFAKRDCTLPADPSLKADLSAPNYSITSNGRIKVESKTDMEKRGVRSPDIADAFCLTFAVPGTFGQWVSKPLSYSNKGIV